MTENTPTKVKFSTISEDQAGQRIDNFLITQLKGAPKSLIYRIIRKGEVRVNKKRCKPDYKLQADDIIRIPPVRVSERNNDLPSAKLQTVQDLEHQIVFEDEAMIVINKPSGLAVHGGSGLSFGMIEALRALRPDARFLELVHRLDRDTSGLVMVAKKRSALRELHRMLRDKEIQKNYWCLVKGHWTQRRNKVDAPLLKNTLKSGERVVRVHDDGKASLTRFKIVQRYSGCTLMEAFPVTGRTHQIRVHCLAAGHPIACDSKYGDAEFTATTESFGLKRLFLHAIRLKLKHPLKDQQLNLEAPLGDSLKVCLSRMPKE
ncbi:23S rRNA pseudouridine(955/2504/2580) synthase RluC [Echinimonas agarilytica]|uniref:Pseudouridine synthase n=1 Tax=Echinimonas agarilytica TaxID=1215918 RepID=A0AA41W8T9_9GAMM|nr:23S rRNA pseudouridine(955/2504/2580) synthase RluC [Echinimonas agarilytica]MCM2681150.1 23S rRNA pseudouridine(955/2504/2580) synthase RluC [Echinimonas agarilytica]